MQKRIAVLISGQSRHFAHACPSINKNVVIPNNADVFMFLTDTKLYGDNTEIILREIFGDRLKALCFDTEDKSYRLQSFNYAYDISKAKNDYCLTADANKKLFNVDGNSTVFIVDEWIKIRKCAELLEQYENENDIKYDIVIKTRPDIAWINEWDISGYDSPNSVYVNTIIRDGHLWMKEYLFAGERDTILKINKNFLDYIGKNTTPCYIGENDCTFVPEIMYGRFIQERDIAHLPLKEYTAGKQFNFNMDECPHYGLIKQTFDNYKTYVDSPKQDIRLGDNFVALNYKND